MRHRLILEQQLSHPWDVTPAEARAIQTELRDRVVMRGRVDPITTVAGIDVGFEDKGATTRAAIAILSYPDLTLVEYQIARRPTCFPYVPGLLSFREVPAVLDALKKLERRPDVTLCDGQGIAHPRRFGVACHIGVLMDLPSVGVAKSRLLGTHGEVPNKRGSYVPLMYEEKTIGAVLRTREGVRPLYISVGHRIDLKNAVDLVMRCTTRYRLPETTRWADRIASGKSAPQQTVV